MQFKCDALLLRYADYNESDRMVTLLTAQGKISAAMKGVRKKGAKLAFAAQPFSFGEYLVNKTANRHLVVSAQAHDGFYALREDIYRFYAASVVCETCDKLVYDEVEGSAYLILAIKTLEKLCLVSGVQAGGVLVEFLLSALKLAGYAVRADVCPVCGNGIEGVLRFDMERGAFCCGTCSNGVRASESTYRTVRGVLAGEEAQGDGVIRALRLLSAYFENRTDARISALHEYLQLSQA